MYRRWGKRLFDIVLSLVGLTLLTVPGLVLAVQLKRRGPSVFFGEQRVGKNGRLFTLYRFRPPTENPTAGRTLDALPLLWHVLLGDMSLVGPQPEPVGYADRLAESEHRVLQLRPGLASPSPAPRDGTFQLRLQSHLRYCDELSWWQDSRILLATAYAKSPVNAGLRRLGQSLQPVHVLRAEKKAVWIAGAGGLAKAMADAAALSGFEVHTEALAASGPARAFVVAVSDNQDRRRLFEELLSQGHQPMTLVHPQASVSANAQLGRGVWVASQATVSAGVVVEDNCLIDTAASLEVDCHIGAHTHLGSGVHLASNVSVGEESTLGIACCVLPNVKVGNRVGVGGGAVVAEDVPDHAAVVATPGRVVQLKRSNRN